MLSSREYGGIKICNPEHSTDYFYYMVAAFNNKKEDSVHIYLGGRSDQVRKDDILGIKAFDGTISRSLGMGVAKGAQLVLVWL